MSGEEWTILDEDGAKAVTFTSFIDLDVKNEGKALSYPIEEGGFANYNKVQTPLDISVTLATQGTEDEFEQILATLDEYQEKPIKLFDVTPSKFYGPVTLESYSNRRTRDDGAGQLTVELQFVEVREAETQVTTTVVTKPKNPTSANNVDTGKTEPQEVDGSVIRQIHGGEIIPSSRGR